MQAKSLSVSNNMFYKPPRYTVGYNGKCYRTTDAWDVEGLYEVPSFLFDRNGKLKTIKELSKYERAILGEDEFSILLEREISISRNST